MFKITLIGALTLIAESIQIDCASSESCLIQGNSSIIVIANKGVNDVVIDCVEPNSCKKEDGIYSGLTVYSSANNTYINCFGDDSCEEISLNFGITPLNGLDSDFNVPRSKVIVTCSGKQSCKGITINNDGIITNGLNIITPTDTTINKGAFMSGLAVCGTQTQCILQCGNDINTCKDAKCYDNCICSGNGCPININQRPTVQPTSPPTNVSSNNNNIILSPTSPVIILPTPEPTPSPIDPRNITTCTQNGCILTPESNYDVICPTSITNCIIECNTAGQCQEAVIVQANSKSVTLICGGINSCNQLKLFNVEQSDITVIISDEAGAQNMLIGIENILSTINIQVDGNEGFGNGELYCDGTCSLNCVGINACKDATYECLSPSNQCNLDCDGANNECPTIDNFGDPSCDEGECTIIADGDTRIVALNNVDKLTVICNENGKQCKKGASGLKVFSAAKETILLCNVTDGCESGMINIGSLRGNRVPKGFKSSQFNRNPIIPLTFEANCNGYSSCKSLYVYTTGNVKSIIDGDGEEALLDTTNICDDCGSLTVNCKEFDGCIGATILCTNPLDCSCIDTYEVDIGNTTSDLATTEAPRESCPLINILFRKQNGVSNINSVNSMVNNKITTGVKLLLPIFIIIGILIFCIGIIMVYYRRSSSKIDDNKDRLNATLNNENIYPTYQVEMQ